MQADHTHYTCIPSQEGLWLMSRPKQQSIPTAHLKYGQPHLMVAEPDINIGWRVEHFENGTI